MSDTLTCFNIAGFGIARLAESTVTEDGRSIRYTIGLEQIVESHDILVLKDGVQRYTGVAKHTIRHEALKRVGDYDISFMVSLSGVNGGEEAIKRFQSQTDGGIMKALSKLADGLATARRNAPPPQQQEPSSSRPGRRGSGSLRRLSRR